MSEPNASFPRVVYVPMGALMACLLGVACSGPPPESTRPSSGVEPGDRIYNVQLALTEEKGEANETVGRAERWWNNQPPADRPPIAQGTESSNPPVTISWKAPFYRVQLGPFASEDQAEAVLKAAESAFPDAFVAPDRAETASPK